MENPDTIARLAKLLSTVVNGSAQSPDFLTALEQIDTLALAERRHLPAELRHFLGNRSYVKAVNFIDKMDSSGL